MELFLILENGVGPVIDSFTRQFNGNNGRSNKKQVNKQAKTMKINKLDDAVVLQSTMATGFMVVFQLTSVIWQDDDVALFTVGFYGSDIEQIIQLL